MLDLLGGRLVWQDPDVNTMAFIVGADHAARCAVPYNPAILKAAAARRIRLSRTAQQRLAGEIEQRLALRPFARALDAPGKPSLWPHQRAALTFIRQAATRHWLLADDVGVGKTDVAIEWARSLGATRTLVVVRNAAKTQWANAILRRDPRADVTVVDGTTLDQYTQAQFPVGWIIAHWESLVLVPEAYLHRHWDAVILDEAHQTQNRKTERTGVVLHLKAHARMAMTGHPYWRAPDQLFPILRFLYPERYRSYWLFFWLHVRATPRVFGGFDIEGPRRPKLLQWELSPFTLRRTKRRVWPHLPAITRTPRLVTLTATGRREYEKLRKQFFAELKTIDGSRTLAIPSMLARTMRMRQYLVDPGLLDAREPSVKYPELLALMDEIQQPIVVFSAFKQALNRFAAVAKRAGKRVALVTGDVREREREAAKQRFLRGDVDALLVTLGAGSESMNYGKYGYIAHLDLPWTARDLQQSEGRVDRPEEGTGALVPTTSHPIIVADSYEERMQEKLNQSHSGFKSVFTVDQLEDLFG